MRLLRILMAQCIKPRPMQWPRKNTIITDNNNKSKAGSALIPLWIFQRSYMSGSIAMVLSRIPCTYAIRMP